MVAMRPNPILGPHGPPGSPRPPSHRTSAMSEPEHGGILAARALLDAGVDTLFALPGGHVLPLFEGARRTGLRLIDTRHEENAVMMAEGFALATGRPAAAAVTAGPGLANAFAGIAEANAAGVPVVVIAGRTGLNQRGRGAVQDLDQLAVVTPVTKWRAECPSAGADPVVRRRGRPPGAGGRPGGRVPGGPAGRVRLDDAAARSGRGRRATPRTRPGRAPVAVDVDAGRASGWSTRSGPSRWPGPARSSPAPARPSGRSSNGPGSR